jgi:hypothetical protein
MAGSCPKKLEIEIQASAEISDQINMVSVMVVIGKPAEKIKSYFSIPLIDLLMTDRPPGHGITINTAPGETWGPFF